MNTYNENGSLSDKDVERYSVLRHKEHRDIYRATGCGMSTVRQVLGGYQKATTDKALAIIKEADKLLKNHQEVMEQPTSPPEADECCENCGRHIARGKLCGECSLDRSRLEHSETE